MLEIEVVGRDDLSRIIERKSVSNHDCSLLELIKQECPKYKESYIPNLSAFVDGVSFQYSDWSIVSLKNSRKLKIEEFQKIKNCYRSGRNRSFNSCGHYFSCDGCCKCNLCCFCDE